MKRLRNVIKQISFFLHRQISRLGLIILPSHYYVPFANINQLEATRKIWQRKSTLPGLNMNLDKQVDNLYRICQPFMKEYEANENYLEATRHQFGPGFGYIEAQALHAVLRTYRPRRVIEVGSGVSTYCTLRALAMNEPKLNAEEQVTCIEPNPYPALSRLGVNVVASPVQAVDLDLFSQLEPNDLLFIDSTHTIRPGGDVNFLILEILPRLQHGVLVHFHDIYLPYDYPRQVLNTYFQWMETSLLRAYLVHNSFVDVIFCMSHLHYERPDALKSVFPDYKPASSAGGLAPRFEPNRQKDHFPASIFLRM